MNAVDRQRAHSLDAVARPLAEWIAELHFGQDPSMADRYGQDGAKMWKAEIRVRIQHLAEAVATDRPALFVQNALWSRAAFVAREVNDTDLKRSLDCMREVCSLELPADLATLSVRIIDSAIQALQSTSSGPCPSGASLIARDLPNSSLARLYLLHLLQRNQHEAANLVFEAAREGRTIPEIYETVITPALAEIGRMWHLQEASVADEHYCTAATQMIMAQLRARMLRKPANGQRILAMSVGGDLHDLGIRMVSDLFEMEGWRTEYLGANMPTCEILGALTDEHQQPSFDLLAVSASTTLSVRAVADFITAIRQHPTCGSIPILVGGAPFHIVDDLWQIVGADGFARDAVSGLKAAAALVGARA
ncbi:MAG: cobalamin-dependent protein [Phycisphaerae bacterium]|nr:cobalamin-dependent protein [Phycisphaerae bacterium]